jgi:high affinity sulfate transporter 1
MRQAGKEAGTAGRTAQVRDDLVAGLTTAAVLIPKTMAYANVATLPVVTGLYTAFVPMLVYAALGTSRVLSVSTTTTIAILTGEALTSAVPGGDPAQLFGATAMLALLVGAVLLVAYALRFGFVANFISVPVLIGFKAGIGVVLIVDQLPKLLGIHITKGSFVHNVGEIFGKLDHVSWPTLAIGVATIALLWCLGRIRPHWPAPLIVIGAAIAGAGLLGWQAHGVALVGTITAGWPKLTLPDIGLAATLWPAALGIALMSFTETIAAGRAFQGPDDPMPRANRELLATGASNAAGAFFGAMPAGGGTSQTAVNRMVGARTQLAGVVAASMTLVTMLFLARLIALMPQATLAGTVIFYSFGMINPAEFRDVLRTRRTEFLWAIAAFGGVMLLGTLKGILVAIVVSLVALAHQTANPPLYELGRKRGTNVFRPRSNDHPDDETFPGLLLLRPEGRLYFVNADHIAAKVRALVAECKPTHVVLDLSGVFDLEYSALQMLIAAERRSREEGGVLLVLAGLNPVVYDVVRRSSLGETLGEERLFFNLEIAIDHLLRANATPGVDTR